MHKDPAEILLVFLYAVVELLYIRPLQKAKDMLLQLSAPLSGDYFYQGDPLLNGLIDGAVQLLFYFAAFIEYIVQV